MQKNKKTFRNFVIHIGLLHNISLLLTENNYTINWNDLIYLFKINVYETKMFIYLNNKKHKSAS